MKNLLLFSCFIISLISCNVDNNYTKKKFNTPNVDSLISGFADSSKNDSRIKLSPLLEIKIDSLLNTSNTKHLYLTRSFELTYCEEGDTGIGPDTLLSYDQDTIIILMNELSERINTNLINNGKTVVLDSSSICGLSHFYDRKHQVMRYFIDVRQIEKNKGKITYYQVIARQWVPQFLSIKRPCIEAFTRISIGEFSIDATNLRSVATSEKISQ